MNYLSAYDIKEYFNGFFMQNLNVYFYALFGLFSGVCFVGRGSFLKVVYLLCVVIFASTLIPSVGKSAGNKLFLKENSRIVINGKTQFVRLIYKDKYKFYYNTNENPKVVRVNLNANR